MGLVHSLVLIDLRLSEVVEFNSVFPSVEHSLNIGWRISLFCFLILLDFNKWCHDISCRNRSVQDLLHGDQVEALWGSYSPASLQSRASISGALYEFKPNISSRFGNHQLKSEKSQQKVFKLYELQIRLVSQIESVQPGKSQENWWI